MVKYAAMKLMTTSLNLTSKGVVKDMKERIVFLDYLRVIACFMVMLVHSIEPFYLGGPEGI